MARGRAAVALLSSDAAALRDETAKGSPPSLAFSLGAALAAWINAADQLDFDLANPSAVGPAHAHLEGPEDFFGDDCRAEALAFEHLTAAARALELSAAEIAAAGKLPKDVVARWVARHGGQAAACR